MEDRFQEKGLEEKRSQNDYLNIIIKKNRSLIGKECKNVLFSYLEDSRLKLEVEVDMVVEDMLKELDTVHEDKLQVVAGDTLMVDKLN